MDGCGDGRQRQGGVELVDDAGYLGQSGDHGRLVLGDGLTGRLGIARRHDLRYVAQRHIEVAQPLDDRGVGQLGDPVGPVPRGRVDRRRHQQALVVVRAQGLDRHERGSGEHADGHEDIGIVHGGQRAPSPRGRVKGRLACR
jgi:hypothetical protein